MIVGIFSVAAYFTPHNRVQAELSSRVLEWGGVVAAAAFVLGGVNLIAVTWPKIRRREPDWPYKCVLLGSAAVMALVGLPWGALGDDRPPGAIARLGHDPDAAARGVAVFELDAPDDVEITIGLVVTHAGRTPRVEAPSVPQGFPRAEDARPRSAAGERDRSPSVRTVSVKSRRRVAGYDAFADTVTVAPGDVVRVSTDPQLRWGADGRVRTWIFDHVFAPCNSTVFALLAFFVASAAFRAFRARNLEAGLLLGAAIVVLLARAPIGATLGGWLPDLAQWILDVPSNGSRRAIMMGAAVAAIATSLRVILGLERSHLGGDS
jgi:hypothetical protein